MNNTDMNTQQTASQLLPHEVRGFTRIAGLNAVENAGLAASGFFCYDLFATFA